MEQEIPLNVFLLWSISEQLKTRNTRNVSWEAHQSTTGTPSKEHKPLTLGTETEPELLRHIPCRRISRESKDRVVDSNESTIWPASQPFVTVICLEPHPHVRNNLYLRRKKCLLDIQNSSQLQLQLQHNKAKLRTKSFPVCKNASVQPPWLKLPCLLWGYPSCQYRWLLQIPLSHKLLDGEPITKHKILLQFFSKQN